MLFRGSGVVWGAGGYGEGSGDGVFSGLGGAISGALGVVF